MPCLFAVSSVVWFQWISSTQHTRKVSDKSNFFSMHNSIHPWSPVIEFKKKKKHNVVKCQIYIEVLLLLIKNDLVFISKIRMWDSS